MSAGGRVKFRATASEMIKMLRAAREFDHLRGMFLHVLSVTTNPAQWEEKQQSAYEAALPTLLLKERSLITSEDAIGRNKLLFPNAVFRRTAFLFGAKCSGCGYIGYGYRMLPLVNNVPNPKSFRRRLYRIANSETVLPDLSFAALRAPFAATLGDTIEPLCPHCRFSFASWVCRFAGGQPEKEAIEICATGWLAERVSVDAVSLARSERPAQRGRPRNRQHCTDLAMARQSTSLPSVRL